MNWWLAVAVFFICFVFSLVALADEEVGFAYITPTLGASSYTDISGNSVDGTYSLGLILEMPFWRYVALEFEGQFSRHRLFGTPFSRNFSRYEVGPNIKFLLPLSIVRFSVGGGFLAIFHQDLGDVAGQDRWTGGAQLLGGVDLFVHRHLGVGIRAARVFPVTQRVGRVGFNRPTMQERVIDSSFYRVMGALSIGF